MGSTTLTGSSGASISSGSGSPSDPSASFPSSGRPPRGGLLRFRRQSIRNRARILAAAALAAFLPAAASLKSWRDGPVRYLLTPDEYHRFGHLPDEAARRAFIEGFWSGIDAQHGDSAGGFERAFEARCAVADARFGNSREPGWKTDRGRVYILLGEPSAVRRQTGGFKAVETEVWIYGDEGAASPPARIAFFRCANGDYRLDEACPAQGVSPFGPPPFSPMKALQRTLESNPGLPLPRATTFVQAVLGLAPSGDAAAGDAAAPTVPAAPAQGGDGRAGHALEATPYFFRAQDGSVLTILSLELLADGASPPPPGGERWVGAVSLEPEGTPRVDASGRSLALGTVPGGSPRGRALFTGAVYLEPGRTYGARYTVEDPEEGAVFVRNSRLTAPDLGAGLQASSIVPAERFGPAPAEPDGAFRVGSEEVVPKPGAVFTRSEMLRLYLQVYGATPGPGAGGADLDVVFRFYLVAGGRERRVGKPFSVRRATGASMGLALPVGDWPVGEYRVAVDLHDRVSGERAAAEGRFRIVDR